jgi:predicted dehydrogenase
MSVLTTNPIRIGVLGVASIATRSVIPAIRAHSDVVLAGIASRTLSKAEVSAATFETRPFGSYEALLSEPDIDAVYIPLPNSLHKEWVSNALRARKHVLVEKSLGVSKAEVDALTELAKATGKVLIENFQFRFHSQHQYAKQILASGQLGDIRLFRSTFGFPPFQDPNNIRYDRSLGGGALLDAGAYPVKATTFLFPNHYDVVAADLRMDHTKGVDVEGSATLRSSSGLVSQIAFGFQHYYQCKYEIWGSKGRLISERAFTAAPGFKPVFSLETADGGFQRIELDADDHFSNMLTHFARTIRSGNSTSENEQNSQQATLIQSIRDIAYVQ